MIVSCSLIFTFTLWFEIEIEGNPLIDLSRCLFKVDITALSFKLNVPFFDRAVH